jgi:hypothetical protein
MSRRRETDRRTVDASPAAKALSARRDRRAAPERRARATGVHSHGARAWREVGSEATGLGVCGIVVRFWARLEHEDAKVGVCRCETAGDDAASGAAYQMSPW